MRSIADQYEKIVYWSDEDECFIGMYPDMFYGGVYCDDPKTVFDELLEVVDEWVEIFEQDGKDLPTPTRTALQAA